MGSKIDSNFKTLFNTEDKSILCPYCQIRFQTLNQLRNHKEKYCTPVENYKILDEMYREKAEEILAQKDLSLFTSKSLIIMKGLNFLKSEWDLYMSYMTNPKQNVLAHQKGKKGKEGASRKPHFEAMFSDFNPEAENAQKFPFLQNQLATELKEDISKFGFTGENTAPDDEVNIPSWLKGKTEQERRAEEEKKDAKGYMYDIDKEDIKKAIRKDYSNQTSKELFDDKDYLKIFDLLRNDIDIKMKKKDVQFYLNEPAKDWEIDFFNRDRNPSKWEIEDLLVELERPGPRRSRYISCMSDMYTIHEVMVSNLLTDVDLSKKDQLQKLIAQRELLHIRELNYLKLMEDFKELYFQKTDYDYLGLIVPTKLAIAFMNLFLKQKYTK